MKELKEKLEILEDTRQQWKVRHYLVSIVMLVIISMLAGHDEPEEMVIFCESKLEKLKEYIELPYGIPHHDTIKRVIAIVDKDQLHLIFYSWLADIVSNKPTKLIDELKKIIAIDGKTECGSNDIHNKAMHILTAFDTENELVLEQLAVDNKTNEITVMPELLDILDLKDCVVTADAMNCQSDIVNKIVEKKGDYVLAIKANKFTMYDEIVDYFEVDELKYLKQSNMYLKTIEKAHSKVEVREYYLLTDIDYIKEGKGKNYNNLTSIGMIHKTTEDINTGLVTEEKRYYICSIKGIETFAKAVRNHWKIENNLHWHLDFTLKSDASTIINKRIVFNLNIIRKLVLSLLKNIDVGRKMSLKNKRTYIASNFTEFIDEAFEQLKVNCKLS